MEKQMKLNIMNIMVKKVKVNMESMIEIKYIVLIAFIIGVIAVIKDE